eukprot:5578953-Ditylum_brightwellii.AAC.3
MGKRDFKRFARGHGVSIKQYHGDNGFFKSKLWTEHCDVAGQEPTEMSGVGTHHQNAIAERVIGLSPLDIFSGTATDYTDLLKTHVWGCPAYVLDPTFQDGKKLPKWHPCKRCGQLNSLIDWDPVLDGPLPELAPEWLSEHELQACQTARQQMPHALVPQQPTPHTVIDDTEDALPQHMPAPEGGDANAEPPPLVQHDNDADSKDNDND